MKLIPVVKRTPTKESFTEYNQAIIRLSKSCLFSLIDAFSQKDFGLDTCFRTRSYLRYLRKKILDPFDAEFYWDSGGFSFIKGQIHRLDIVKMIECYTDIILKEEKLVDYFFSLDLPKSIKYSSFNTYDNLYRYNRISLSKTFHMIEKQPNLADRFFFIWQFRQRIQYEVWKRLYDDLVIKGYARYIRCRAIGGMVGIKGMTGINFSPFIALAYRCFKDYLTAENYNDDFRLHLLGVNTKSDRFLIAFLEKLFCRYLQSEGINKDAIMTYDSIAYNRNATYMSRNLKVYCFQDDEMDIYQSPLVLPDKIIREVYFTKRLYNNIGNEFDRLKNNRPFENIYSIFPLNLFSILQQDKYFEYIIEKFNIVGLLCESTGMQGFIMELENLLWKMLRLNPDILTKSFKRSVYSGMTKIYRVHNWYDSGAGAFEDLDDIIIEFISMIGADR